MGISLDDISQFLVSGWCNVPHLDLSRLVQSGQTVTVILSDGPFEVPGTLPGGATTIGSKQHTFSQDALILMRVVSRADE